MEKQQEKICRNCKYFYEYYIKTDTRFQKIGVGNCTREKDKKYVRRKDFSAYFTCEFWEPDPNNNDGESIKNLLKSMRERIIQIENILKD